MSTRDKLRDFIQSNMHRIDGFHRWTFQAPVDLAAALIADGYRKPVVVGYAVVGGKSGQFVRSFGAGERDAALAFADESTRDCADMGIDFDYRIAEIVEAAA
ncbi:hypothetical protein [Arthrobacter sp. B2a2-09]|uniref:hypothetical protein n=1 Tax=Arthrobacter sp. B2a2-09 TaxID=2952822 RepID=UPI0022CD7917|nr:hypothetical protein [Arthrobacter sp. B2a2-09]MCZ9884110.1 hypothetical protein [Arthrobacter sp. B2a2-09]